VWRSQNKKGDSATLGQNPASTSLPTELYLFRITESESCRLGLWRPQRYGGSRETEEPTLEIRDLGKVVVLEQVTKRQKSSSDSPPAQRGHHLKLIQSKSRFEMARDGINGNKPVSVAILGAGYVILELPRGTP
jgi:hypothetical protein